MSTLNSPSEEWKLPVSSKSIEPNPGPLLQCLWNHYIHQNTLMWNSFFRTLTHQLALLAGAYALRGTYFAPAILLAGSTLFAILFLLSKKYERDK
jgi:hypothetical protein